MFNDQGKSEVTCNERSHCQQDQLSNMCTENPLKHM